MSSKESHTLEEVLSSLPPGREYNVHGLVEFKLGESPSSTAKSVKVFLPEISLDCDTCGGKRTFKGFGQAVLSKFEPLDRWMNKCFVTYQCKMCDGNFVTYALGIDVGDIESPHKVSHRFFGKTTEKILYGSGKITKFGQWPPFGPSTPAKLLGLFDGSSKELYLNGRRAESQGLGIGAHAYYRRVVENSRTRLLEKIIEVAKLVDAPTTAVKQLENAVKETRFAESMKLAADALPKALIIGEQNPLTVLHKATSKGLHEETDAVCLAKAQAIRKVLVWMIEAIDGILKNRKEVENAIKELMKQPGVLDEPEAEETASQ